MRLGILRITASLALLLSTQAHEALAQAFPPDREVQQILEERVAIGRNPGIVVGMLDANGPRVVAVGTSGKDGLALDGNTLLEIGSASKVFTSVLMADMVLKGETRLDEPVQSLLPDRVRIPDDEGRPITLQDISTHRSALPRMPSNFAPSNPQNPYADYSVEQMYEFLSGYELPRHIGDEFEYSNLAVGLLGHALALLAGTSYEGLARERIFNPLGMHDTGIELSEELLARMAQGHTPVGAPTSNWDIPTLAGAGAIRSTANDMLLFLAANLDGADTPISPAMAETHEIRNEVGGDQAMALGWLVFQRFEDLPIHWHNGGTGGFRFFMGLDKTNGRAVTVLTNASVSVDDLGFHLLDQRHELSPPEPMVERVEIEVDPEVLQKYVGVYELTIGMTFTVTLEGGQLFVDVSGQGKTALFAESEEKFFFKDVEAQITFQMDDDGLVTGLVLHQSGQDIPGERIGG